MAALYAHTTRATGTNLTAAIYNGDHQNHIDNGIPTQLDDYSASVPQMQGVTDPGEVASESLAASLAGEIERLRFAINDIKSYVGLTSPQWYSTPTGTVALGKGGTGAALVDPNADAMLFWDDSAGSAAFLTPGNGLAINGTVLARDDNLTSWEVDNLAIVSSVAGNNLTIAVKTKAGTDPSASDPIVFKFRKATLSDGSFDVVTLTSALSFVVDSGSTLDTISGAASRIYVAVVNDAGTLRLGVWNPYATATPRLIGLFDSNRYTSTAPAAGAADQAQVLYTSVAVSNKAIHTIGYVESTQATAGTWATTPSKTHVLKGGDRRTGDIVSTAHQITGAVATGTTPIPVDDTIPLVSEGDQYMGITLVNQASGPYLVRVRHVGQYASGSVTNNIVVALFRNGGGSASAVQVGARPATANAVVQVSLEYVYSTEGSDNIDIRAGCSTAGTTTFNGSAGARLYGGALSSSLTAEAIFI